MSQNNRDLNFVGGLKDTPMKTYSTYINDISDKRIGVIYEAYADTTDTQSCMATVYVYHGSTSDVHYTIEKQAAWNGAWDTQAASDASTYFAVNGEV